MLLDNVVKAKQIVNKYPEVFEALLEFERTKKIPLLYRRKRINVTINENIARDFKNYCQHKGLNMSRVLEKKMIEYMKQNYD